MKYEITNITKTNSYGVKLHRIKALVSFNDVKAGDLGGWVQCEDNLWQYGDCWIYDDASAFHGGRVDGDAQARGYAEIDDNAQIYEHVVVKDHASVSGARISGNIKISGYARIQNVTLSGVFEISGNAKIEGVTK